MFYFIYSIIQSTLLLLSDFEIIFNILYIGMAIIGLSVHPFYFAFLLSEFLRTDYLKNVVKAVYLPRK